MADTPATDTGETATPGSVSNDVSQTSAPAGDNGSTAEVERLRKEAEQAKMRANQLANELASITKAEEAAKQKQMEDTEELRKLNSELKARLDERDAKDAERERQAELQTATQDVLKDYSEGVRKLAETTGLKLSDDSDEAKAALKAKLDAIKSQVNPVYGTSSNNGYAPVGESIDREALVKREGPGMPSPMAEAAARNDQSVLRQYVHSLPQIERMREISRGN